eukprot:3380911-Pleurochrysis_carterae.AAC.1
MVSAAQHTRRMPPEAIKQSSAISFGGCRPDCARRVQHAKALSHSQSKNNVVLDCAMMSS